MCNALSVHQSLGQNLTETRFAEAFDRLECFRLFLKNPGRVFSRDDLLSLVWGCAYAADEKGVNFHIMNLRKKLNVNYIETVRGVGYKIAKENP